MKNPEKFWDRVSGNYDKKPKKVIDKPSRTILALKKYLDKNNLVLDYGCATGGTSIKICDFVKEVQGIDISIKMIEVANKKIDSLDISNIKFNKANIFDESLKPQMFNSIISFNVLHLLTNIEEVICRIYDLLRPGGHFISNTPCLSEQKYFMGPLISLGGKLNLIPDVKMLNGKELEKLISDQNFEVLENRKLDKSSSNYFIVAKKL